MDDGGSLQGALFWQWDLAGDGASPNIVHTGDSTYKLAVANAQKLRGIVQGASTVPNCTPGSYRSLHQGEGRLQL